MNLIEIFSILLIHWFADFVLQTDKQATGKSKNWSDLLEHTFTYTMVWVILVIVLAFSGYKSSDFGWSENLMWFPLITFVCHTITDYFTSRLNSKLIPKREYLYQVDSTVPRNSPFFRYLYPDSWHNFFVSVGFDQVLHYVQLFTTYYLLKG